MYDYVYCSKLDDIIEAALPSVTVFFTACLPFLVHVTICLSNTSTQDKHTSSLYSTATQNTWRWGLQLAMHLTPEFCVTQHKIYQHVGIFCVR